MKRILAICACALLTLAAAQAQPAMTGRKPMVTAPAALRQTPAKAVCLRDDGTVSQPGEYPWTSRTSDGVSHDCTPYGCNMATGLCRNSAASTNECRPGWSWLAPSGCSRCGSDAYWDDTTQSCKQEKHLGG